MPARPDPLPTFGAIVIGGGAAGYFGAIACAERCPGARVLLLERGSTTLGKVRISGGGRCNVTTATTEPRDLASYYPRGGRALIGPFTRFGPRETVAWFEARGVRLKTEPDGRLFPVSNTSSTIIECLAGAARAAGVEVRTGADVRAVRAVPERRLRVETADGTGFDAERVLLATGGCRAESIVALLRSTGHSVEPPVPSLFTFHVGAPWLTGLAGSVALASCRCVPTKSRTAGGGTGGPKLALSPI
jgi:predicted Rossmann fold flavoprotein